MGKSWDGVGLGLEGEGEGRLGDLGACPAEEPWQHPTTL